MKLLIVEDDQKILDALDDAFIGVIEPAELTVCKSRDSAFEAIESGPFDFAVLDLKIPTVDDQLDDETAHGQAVFERLRSTQPGTPICFLTAYATDDFTSSLLTQGEKDDVWGSGTLPCNR